VFFLFLELIRLIERSGEHGFAAVPVEAKVVPCSFKDDHLPALM